jgi:ATP-dependent helicase HepA
LLRVGDPLIDTVAAWGDQDDAGRTFALWRHHQEQEHQFGGDWVGFRIELRVEPDIEYVLRTTEQHCYPINEPLFRRRAETWFSPIMRLVFIDSDMHKVEPKSALFALLNRPYQHALDGGHDSPLRGNFQNALRLVGVNSDWPQLCQRAHSEAVHMLKSMPRLQTAIAESAERAQKHCEALLEQLSCHGDETWLAYETDLARALVCGIRHPEVRLDSIGFIVLSSRPAPAGGL